MGVIAWIVLGIIAGAIAKAIYPGHQGGGIFATIALGILGALLGGFLADVLKIGGAAFASGSIIPSIGSIVLAVVGAILLIFIWGLVTRRAV